MNYIESRKLEERIQELKIRSELDRIESLIKTTHNYSGIISFFDSFSPYLVRRIGKMRLIAKITKVENVQLLCLLDILHVTNKEYESFKMDHHEGYKKLKECCSECEKKFSSSINSVDLAQTINEMLPPLPECYVKWLEPAQWHDLYDDNYIYESEDWVINIQSSDFNDYRKDFRTLIHDIADDKEQGEMCSDFNNVFMHSDGKNTILFTKCPSNKYKILYLYNAYLEKPSQKEIEKCVNKYISPKLTHNEIAQSARRAYPSYFLAADEEWLAIEKGSSNLALSSEEIKILEDVSKDGSCKLPIFINGQAGSGKSTLLIYLFADYLYRKIKNKNLDGNLLFTCYSDQLLDVLKKDTVELLESHHRFDSKKSTERKNLVKNSFKPFKQLLRKTIMQANRFDDNYYISYSIFRSLYNNANKNEDNFSNHKFRKKTSAEICWYVIRTYIKGTNENHYLTPEEYQEMPKKDKSSYLSFDEYKEIYEKVWKNWYYPLTTEKNRWDEQDMVRTALNEGECKEDYAIIFCDEAQDLTRIELRFLMKLSLLIKYDITKSGLLSLPFAFAGDPLQTLNPTGFNWSRTKSVFFEEIIQPIASTFSKNQELKVTLCELTKNYRSTSYIVSFTNLIQLWRSNLFNIESISPQQKWSQLRGCQPCLFIMDKNITYKQFNEKVKDTVIILPCEKGDEIKFIENDDVLKKMFPEVTAKPKNILTAYNAKGLEFDRVILYSFGNETDSMVWDNLNNENNKNPQIKHEYFFNKLYVAATRAKKNLFIIDTKNGVNNLWKKFNKDNYKESLKYTKKDNEWKNNILPIIDGDETTLKEMEETNPLSIAEEFMTKGKNLKDSELLYRAMLYYNEAGPSNEELGKECEAWALRFDEKFDKSGNLFNEIFKFSEARKSFWSGSIKGLSEKERKKCWEALTKIEDHNSLSKDYSLFMTSNVNDYNSLEKFREFLYENKDNLIKHPPHSKIVIKEFCERIEKNKETIQKKEASINFAEKLEALNRNHNQTLKTAGLLYYLNKNYDNAVKCWERKNECKPDNKIDYWRAKAEISECPNKLSYYFKANDYEQIIRSWKDWDNKEKATADIKKIVCSSFEYLGNREESFMLKVTFAEVDEVKNTFRDAYIKSKPEPDQIQKLINYLLKKADWIGAFGCSEHYGKDIPEQAEFYSQILKSMVNSHKELKLITDLDDCVEKYIIELMQYDKCESIISFDKIGAVLEKVNLIGKALEFYEKYTYDAELDRAQYARKRWLISKKNQESYERGRNRIEKAEQIHDDIQRKENLWNLKVYNISTEPPLLKITPKIDVIPISGLNERFLKKVKSNDRRHKFEVAGVNFFAQLDSMKLQITTPDLKNVEIDMKGGNLLNNEGAQDISPRKSEDGKKIFSFIIKGTGHSVKVVNEKTKKYVEIKFTEVQDQKDSVKIEY